MDTRPKHGQGSEPKPSIEGRGGLSRVPDVPARDFFVRQESPTTAMPQRIAEEG